MVPSRTHSFSCTHAGRDASVVYPSGYPAAFCRAGSGGTRRARGLLVEFPTPSSLQERRKDEARVNRE